jgi:hypothetical protein
MRPSSTVLSTVSLAFVQVWLAGCDSAATPAEADRVDGPSPATTMASGAGRSPAEVTRLLQQYHQQRVYAEIAPLIVAERRDAVVNLLRAIDEVIDADAALQKAVESEYAGPMTRTCSLTAVKNNLGPFSEQVRLINQRFRGATAFVTLQEGDNVPLIHARFEKVGMRWLYRPESTPARMVIELERLAQTLRDTREAVRGGVPLESYLDAFAYRVLPQMSRVMTAADDPTVEIVTGHDPD